MPTPRTTSSHELRQSLPLVEEAANLLRQAPPLAWACHLLGVCPFVFTLILFWSELGGRATASEKALAWGLPLALLHLWMRVCQSRFCALLTAVRNGREPDPWPAALWLRVASVQARFGVATFFALLPSLLISIPYGWTYAFYQSLAVTAPDPQPAQRGWKAARSAPYQNHAVMAWLLLFRFVAFANILSSALVLPNLIKLFVPLEWAFTRYPLWFLNSTALCVMAALTYLATDPLVKAVYVLRAFYGLARTTGEDLRTDWRRTSARTARAALARSTLALLLLLAVPATASDPSDTIPRARPAAGFTPPVADTGEVDRQLDLALQHPRYDWRTPADFSRPDTWVGRQLQHIVEALGRGFRWLRDSLGSLTDWLRRFFRRSDPHNPHDSSGLSPSSLMALLSALLLATAALLLVQLWRARRPKPSAEAQPAAPAPAQPVPDLADESVTADVLPDDEWLALAGRLRDAHDYRKAARAFFLALLACLARRHLLILRASKTNSDYLRELRRRTAGQSFDDTPLRHATHLFEAGWYGDHLVTDTTLDDLRADVEACRHA